MNFEIWKPLINNSDYEVSNLGRVRSLKYNKIKIIKLNLDKDGYKQFTGYLNTKKVGYKVHKEVLKSFVGTNDNMWALHKDDNKNNNALENLYWGTPKQNAKDRDQYGRHLKGSKVHNANFSPEIVTEIRKQYSDGTDMRTLSKIYNVSYRCINSLIRNLTYKGVE